ncbi:hypothetical protein F442_14673 [Phytophthora nicotianae P10297]|uniref:Uncharacterized protein n=1 Tax=Phytophthora nicotianae P10297 TaxID=1317064 RepID=W2YRR0_PHYNI|nr:hypothetical protein F442_14673 [Phytophthora nicotianae P10297]
MNKRSTSQKLDISTFPSISVLIYVNVQLCALAYSVPSW